MHLFIFLIASVLFCTAVKAQTSDTSAELKTLHSIYEFHFEKSSGQLQTFAEKNARLKQLLEIFYLRWKEIPVAFSPASNTYQQSLLKNLAELSKEKTPTHAVIYYQICTYLFFAEYHSSLGEPWSALKYAQKAYPLVVTSMDKNYTQPEFIFLKGLYLYYIEYYKQKNLFYRLALSPLRKGNKEDGLKILKRCADKKSMTQTEAKIYLAHILLQLEKKSDEALPYSKSLAESYPKNIKFAELYAENLIACKKYTDATTLVAQLEEQHSAYYSIPGHVLRGLIEEEYFHNAPKAKEAYLLAVKQELKPVEYFQKIARLRLKNW